MNPSLSLWHPRLKKIALWVAGIVVGIGVLGFLVVPPVVKSVATEQLAKFLQRPVSIGEIGFNPYKLAATVRDFEIKERDGSRAALRFDELALNLELESLVRGGVVVSELRLTNPVLGVVRYPDRSYNWTDLIEKILNQPESEPTRFSVNNIRVGGGRIDFDDQPSKARHAVTDLQLGVPFVSNLPSKVDIDVEPTFSASVDGAPIALGGKAKPFKDTHEAQIVLNLDGLDLPKYFDYVPLPLNFSLPTGKLDLHLTVSFAQQASGAPTLAATGTAALKQLEITDKGGAPVLKLLELAVDLKALDVFGRRAEVSSVRLRSPELQVSRLKDGSISLASLMPKASPGTEAAPAPDKQKAPVSPFRYSVAEAKLSDGRVRFADQSVGFETQLESLDLGVSNLGNAPGQAAQIAASLKTAMGEELKHTGTLTLEPLAAKGRIEVANLGVANYAPYYAERMLFKIASGTLGASAGYEFAPGEAAPKLVLDEIAVKLAELRLQRPNEKEPFYRLGALDVSGGRLDLGARTVAIGEVTTRDARLQVARDKDGTLSLQRLFPASAATEAAAKDEQPWQVAIARVATAGYDVLFEDRSLPRPARLSLTGIEIAAENLSNRQGEQAKFSASAKLNKHGTLKLSGSATGRKANVAVDARRVEILPFQPYFAEKLNVTVTRGAVSVRGNLGLELPDSGAARVSFRGDATVSDFHTVDNANSTDLLVWKSLFVGGIDLGRLQPLALDIREVALSDFYSRLIINPEGRINLQQIVKAPAPAGAAAPTPAAAPAPAAQGASAERAAPGLSAPKGEERITVQKVTLQAGRVNFTDLFIRPNYSAELEELGGQVSGLSSDLGSTADVELRGKVNEAPLEILGKINPLAGNLFLDIKASVKGMELAPLSPYSGKYAGYAIEKGKLSVGVAYKIENQKLEAQNNVYLDQLTFGERVDSPDATKLPVLLAVSLLKDRNGVIDVNLPIGGSLDDPDFSVGGIIVRVIVNLLTKAITAPFSLLASAFGGGEELGYVEFGAGRAALDAAGQEKMKTLAKALNDRPGLKIEIAGRVDPAADKEGLKRASIERKVKAQKLKDTVKGGAEAGSVDQIEIGAEEYLRYLKAAYKEEKFPKPRNLIGLAKDLPAQEMEKLMLTHAEVTEEDLRQLANRRAHVAKDYLVSLGKVADERVFIIAPKVGAAEVKDKGAPTRAEFSLK